MKKVTDIPLAMNTLPLELREKILIHVIRECIATNDYTLYDTFRPLFRREIVEQFSKKQIEEIFETKFITQAFICDFGHMINKRVLFYYQRLSDTFLRNHGPWNPADWYEISRFQNLSESFIIEFKDHVHWRCIWVYQTLSEAFIVKHAKKEDWFFIGQNKNLQRDFLNKYYPLLRKGLLALHRRDTIIYFMYCFNEPSLLELLKAKISVKWKKFMFKVV